MIKCPACENELDSGVDICLRCGCLIEIFTNKEDYEDYLLNVVTSYKHKWEERLLSDVDVVVNAEYNCIFAIEKELNSDGFRSFSFYDFSSSEIYDVSKLNKKDFLNASNQKFSSIKIDVNDWNSLIAVFKQSPFIHSSFLLSALPSSRIASKKGLSKGNWNSHNYKERIRQLHEALNISEHIMLRSKQIRKAETPNMLKSLNINSFSNTDSEFENEKLIICEYLDKEADKEIKKNIDLVFAEMNLKKSIDNKYAYCVYEFMAVLCYLQLEHKKLRLAIEEKGRAIEMFEGDNFLEDFDKKLLKDFFKKLGKRK